MSLSAPRGKLSLLGTGNVCCSATWVILGHRTTLKNFIHTLKGKKTDKGEGVEGENFRDQQWPHPLSVHTVVRVQLCRPLGNQGSWEGGVYLSAQGEIEIEFGEPSVSCGEEMSQKKKKRGGKL